VTRSATSLGETLTVELVVPHTAPMRILLGRLIAPLVVSSMLVLAACGDDDGGNTPAEPDAAPAGTLTCAELIGAWDRSFSEADFVSPEAANAYAALEVCACEVGGSCGQICDSFQNGTGNPNFCDGVSALAQCDSCLNTDCSLEYTDCMAN
jgi:hypothetical protein